MPKELKEIPSFKSEDEEREFWASHDSTEYINWDIKGLDTEQLQLGSSDKFWRLMSERRQEKTISRAVLEQRISKKGQ